jgi:uncharacterized protein YbjT (DUF2867 family)
MTLNQTIWICLTGLLVMLAPLSSADDLEVDVAKPLILVIGATGKQGGAVARALLERNYRVRALTRSPEKPAALALSQIGAELWKGDMNDRDSIVLAMTGMYGVFSVQTWWGENGLVREIRQGKLVADVAKQLGIEHFVYTSVASADKATGIPHFESKWKIEQHIRALALPYTIVRPVSFMDSWERERESIMTKASFGSPMSPGKPLQEVAVRDIGRIVAEAFDAPTSWLGRAIEIAGDEYTMTEMAAKLSNTLGKEVQFEQIPWAAFEEAAGEELTIMFRWFEEVGYSVDIDALRAQFSKPTSMAEYLRIRGWDSGE